MTKDFIYLVVLLALGTVPEAELRATGLRGRCSALRAMSLGTWDLVYS